MLWGCSNIPAAPGVVCPQLLMLEMQQSRVYRRAVIKTSFFNYKDITKYS